MPVVKGACKRKADFPVEEVKCDIAPHMEEEDIEGEDDLIDEFEAVLEEVQSLVEEVSIAVMEGLMPGEAARLEKFVLSARTSLDALVAQIQLGSGKVSSGGKSR